MRSRPFLALVATVLAVASLAAGPAGAAPQDQRPTPSSAAGTTASPEAPEAAEAALTGVARVETGYYHSCALLVNRQVRCWGDNDEGQLGDGNDVGNEPTAVVTRNASDTANLGNVTQLALGDYHTCALLTNGQVRCWGKNASGQLGDGSNDSSALPVAVRNGANTANLSGVRAIAAESDGMCALLGTGQVRCWGEDDYGQLGNGAPLTNSNLPVVVKNTSGGGQLGGVVQIDGGYDANCARLANGQARCWGYDGTYGALGNQTGLDSPFPVVVLNAAGTAPMANIAHITPGGYHTCALLTDATARCFGYGEEGALGNGVADDSKKPVVVRRPTGARPLGGIRAIVASQYHTCALVTGGQVRCWGDDQYAQVGDGTIASPNERLRPYLVRNSTDTGALGGVTQLAGQAYHSCVRQNNGQVRCWGYNSDGAVGDGSGNDQPLPRLIQV